MRTSRWATAGVAAVVVLAGSWMVRNEQSNAQPAGAVTFRQKVEERKAVLDQQERKRLEILDGLEFTPRVFPSPRPPLCLRPKPTPAAAIDPHRSLFVHDRATLDAGPDFSLRRTLSQIATQVAPVVPGTTDTTVFRQFWDTQNAAPGVTAGPHCSDNGTTINGFPINCPRNEGSEAVGTDSEIKARIAQYRVLALVNRLDLAHQGWRNCGEYRIIYGKRGPGRSKNLIIFEAVLPNPRPGCREGCVEVAEFWKSLSTINDPVSRAKLLERFFYAGLPGYRPVVHVNHYSAKGVSTGYGSSGSGQIRTNQFLQTAAFQPWLLKEFKTVIDCGGPMCTFNIVPIMVKVNPFGPLWNEDDPQALGPVFRADTVAQLPSLSSGELLKIGYAVDLPHDAGQSMSLPGTGFVDNYRDQMNSAVATGFRVALTGALTSDQIANRALTQSCAGCHEPRTFGIDAPDSIGMVNAPVGSPVATIDHWPAVVPAGFVHVDVNAPVVRPELAANPAAFGTGLGQIISPALLDFFLPERKNFLVAQLNAPRCPCVSRRFIFLSADARPRALDIEARVQRQFAEKLEAIDQRALEALAAPEEERETHARLLQERQALLAQRDTALAAEFKRAGIVLPDAEQLDLQPQTLKLRASTEAQGDPRRASALLIREVNDLLKQEPPRRTVTGSFRAH